MRTAVLALELAFALLALLILGRRLLLGSRDSACLFAALALALQGTRLALRRNSRPAALASDARGAEHDDHRRRR